MRSGTEIWCNGSTTDFGSVCLGSNPGISTIWTKYRSCDISSFFLQNWLPAPFSAPISLTKPPPVCAGTSLRTHQPRKTSSRVRWNLFPHPSASQNLLPCALEPLSAPIRLAIPPPGCTRGRLRTPEPVVVAEGNWLRAGTAFGLSFPALSAGPLPPTSRGRLRPPGASCLPPLVCGA